MKRFIAMFVLILVVAINFSTTGFADNATAQLANIYTEAELAMATGDYIGAASKFDSLGTYSDSTQMAMYCKAISAAEDNRLYDIAIAAFETLGDFRDSAQLKQYYYGRAAEDVCATKAALYYWESISDQIDEKDLGDIPLESFDWAVLDDVDFSSLYSRYSDDDLSTVKNCYLQALATYSSLMLFKDCLSRATNCQAAIDAIEAEEITRQEASIEAEYQAALTLERNGSFTEAIEAFKALMYYNNGEGYKDSQSHISACETGIIENKYQEAMTLEANGEYTEAYNIYIEILDYKDSRERSANIRKNHFEAEDVLACYNGHAIVQKNGGYGIIDTEMNVIVPFEYDCYINYSEDTGLAILRKNGKYGMFNMNGERIIPFSFDHLSPFVDGLARAKDGDKFGYIDKSGIWVIRPEWDDATSFNDGVAAVKRGKKWVYIDTDGKIILECPGDRATATLPFRGGFDPIQKGGKWGLIDHSGNIVIPCEYDHVVEFFEGLAHADKDGKRGYLDTNGSIVVPFIYDKAHDFSEGFAGVCIDGKWGQIDKAGNIIISCQWDQAYACHDGMIWMINDNTYACFDTTGTMRFSIDNIDPNGVTRFDDGCATVIIGGKTGLIDTDGNYLLPVEYEKIKHDDSFIFALKGKYLEMFKIADLKS